MNHVLIIAYYYPPAGGAGVQRTLKFTKYLPDFGWIPHVLTVNASNYQLLDHSFDAEIPPAVQIHRAPAARLPTWVPWRLRNLITRWLLVVDEQIGWYPYAVRAGKELLNEHKINAIYSTSPPYTDQLVGYALKRLTNLPWLVDFRDPWVGNFARRNPTRIHQQLDNHFEKIVIHNANQIIVVSPWMQADLLVRYPDLAEDKVYCLPNGYDSADFTGNQIVNISKDKFSIVHTGSFYSRYRTTEYFIEALQKATTENRILRDKLQVFFVGNIGRTTKDMISQSSVADLIEVTGYLPHQQSVAYLPYADALLLVIESGPGSQAVLTGKLFEYLAARRPILALVPEGAAADLIREARAGFIVNPNDVQGIADVLVNLYELWKNGALKSNSRQEVITCYERRSQAAHLSSKLNGLISESRLS